MWRISDMWRILDFLLYTQHNISIYYDAESAAPNSQVTDIPLTGR